MKISCPHCGQHYDVEETDVGKEADCTNCGKRFQVKVESSVDGSNNIKKNEERESFLFSDLGLFSQNELKRENSSPSANKKGASESTGGTSSSPYCPYCGGEIVPGVKKCRHCGEWIEPSAKPKNPVVYVLLALFLGLFGIHNFYADEDAGSFKIVGLVVVGLFAVFAAVMSIFVALIMLGIYFLIIALVNMVEMANCDSRLQKAARNAWKNARATEAAPHKTQGNNNAK